MNFTPDMYVQIKNKRLNQSQYESTEEIKIHRPFQGGSLTVAKIT
jgi:hypothetical protein